MIDAVLVPTDGSEGARVGARRGIDVAAALDAEVHVLSAVDARETEPFLSWSADDSSPVPEADRTDREQALEAAAERAVESIARLARRHLSGGVTTAVEWGVPFRTIAEYADEHGVGLIAMGTAGRTGLQRVLLGSVAEKTLRTAPVPVLVVPESADVVEVGDGKYDTVVLPTDGSEGAEAAVEWGVSLAAAFGATIHAVYSVDTSRFPAAERAAGLHDALGAVGRDALATVRERAESAGVSVVGAVASGPAARVVLESADEHDADLIVMGTHGRSGIERFLVGSVTETVVRNADVPVCCVPMAGPS